MQENVGDGGAVRKENMSRAELACSPLPPAGEDKDLQTLNSKHNQGLYTRISSHKSILKLKQNLKKKDVASISRLMASLCMLSHSESS